MTPSSPSWVDAFAAVAGLQPEDLAHLLDAPLLAVALNQPFVRGAQKRDRARSLARELALVLREARGEDGP
jgi:hypothetical protein